MTNDQRQCLHGTHRLRRSDGAILRQRVPVRPHRREVPGRPHVDALEAAMASATQRTEREAIRSKASPATCRSCAFTPARESPMHCAPTISTAHTTLMPDLRESHVAVLEALKNLEEWDFRPRCLAGTRQRRLRFAFSRPNSSFIACGQYSARQDDHAADDRLSASASFPATRARTGRPRPNS